MKLLRGPIPTFGHLDSHIEDGRPELPLSFEGPDRFGRKELTRELIERGIEARGDRKNIVERHGLGIDPEMFAEERKGAVRDRELNDLDARRLRIAERAVEPLHCVSMSTRK